MGEGAVVSHNPLYRLVSRLRGNDAGGCRICGRGQYESEGRCISRPLEIIKLTLEKEYERY